MKTILISDYKDLSPILTDGVFNWGFSNYNEVLSGFIDASTTGPRIDATVRPQDIVSPMVGHYTQTYRWRLDATTLLPVGVMVDTSVGSF
jgi:hypothetical protein